MNSHKSLIVLLIAVVAAVGIVAFWHPKFGNGPAVSDTQGEDEIIDDLTNDINQDVPQIDYDGTPYGLDEETAEFYIEQADDSRQVITTPFDLNSYHGLVTRYGTLFWKRGPEKNVTLSGFEDPMPYEAGIDPDFRWYDSAKKEFAILPEVKLSLGDQKFERVYGAYASISEMKIVVEIGEYDTASPEFEPGLVDGQPVKTHGLVFNVGTRKLESGDPLTVFRQALDIKSTLFMGMSWDSKRGIAVGVPGGEGCGAYDVLKFVDLNAKTATTAGGRNSFNFIDEECNPANGISINERWLVLYGPTKDGQSAALIFDHAHGTTPVKQKSYATSADAEGGYLDSINTDKEFPVLTFTDGATVDFNT